MSNYYHYFYSNILEKKLFSPCRPGGYKIFLNSIYLSSSMLSLPQLQLKPITEEYFQNCRHWLTRTKREAQITPMLSSIYSHSLYVFAKYYIWLQVVDWSNSGLGGNMFSHQNRLTNDRSTAKLNTQYGAKIEKGVTRVPLKPRCNPSSPRGLPPTSPRQSDPKCQAPLADKTGAPFTQSTYDIRRVICLSRYFFIAQRTGLTGGNEVSIQAPALIAYNI